MFVILGLNDSGFESLYHTTRKRRKGGCSHSAVRVVPIFGRVLTEMEGGRCWSHMGSRRRIGRLGVVKVVYGDESEPESEAELGLEGMKGS